MAYELCAVIAAADLLQAATGTLPEARVVPLRQGLGLLPMTEELLDAVQDVVPDVTREAVPHSGHGDTHGFRNLPGGFERTLASWSASGPVAYVEADFFGGAGEQTAAVWHGGRLHLGPLHKPEQEPFPSEGSPISQALRHLGATCGDEFDEFAAVGLHRHRRTRSWASET